MRRKEMVSMPNTGTTRPVSPLCGRTLMSDLAKDVDKAVLCFVSLRLGRRAQRALVSNAVSSERVSSCCLKYHTLGW
jgi:hypothetical protein